MGVKSRVVESGAFCLSSRAENVVNIVTETAISWCLYLWELTHSIAIFNTVALGYSVNVTAENLSRSPPIRQTRLERSHQLHREAGFRVSYFSVCCSICAVVEGGRCGCNFIFLGNVLRCFDELLKADLSVSIYVINL